MLLVKSDMIILEEKKLSSKLHQLKIELDGLFYKRLEFMNQDGTTCVVQWLQGGEFLSTEMEKIMEKIYQEKESN
jgi:hypothetical protein